MARLRANNGIEAGQLIALPEPSATLGRHPNCDIVVDVGAVSRKHCRIDRDDHGFLISDLDSRNGTYLNEELDRIAEPRRLRQGDVIKICDASFTFLDDQPPEHAAVESSNSWLRRVDPVESSKIYIDDSKPDNPSTIMSKLSVSGDSQRAQLTATPQAKLIGLIDIVQSLSRTLALDEVLPRVLDGLFEIFLQADRGFIVLKSPEGKLIPVCSKSRRNDDRETIRVSRAIVDEVIQAKRAILSADAATDKRFELSESVADFRIRSMMCAPLLDAEGNVLGVMQVDAVDQHKRFQSDDLEVLATVALQAGIAIENAQLHEAALVQAEIERDLELAHEVQKGFLPDSPPQIPEFHFYDYYQPAHHVGGDYFDYIPLPGGRVAIVVADVVGHGVAAALMMAKLSAEVRFCLALEPTVASATSRINRAISGLQLDRFITMVIVVVDPQDGRLTMTNAGHSPPLIRKVDGTIQLIGEDVANLPVGIVDDVDYEQAEAKLEEGEMLLLWTDGIHEAMNAEDEQYGNERLEAQFSQSTEPVPINTGRDIISSVETFLDGTPPFDDMCLVCVGRAKSAKTGEVAAPDSLRATIDLGD